MRLRQFVQEALSIWSNERPTQLAAGLAYYGMISLGPLLYVVVTVAEFLLGRAVAADQVRGEMTDSLGPQVAEFFGSIFESTTVTTSGDTPLLTIASIIILLYGASGLFSELRYALNRVWQVPRGVQRGARNFVVQRSIALVMLLGIGILVVGLTQVNDLSARLGSQIGAGQGVLVANEFVAFLLLTLSLALVNKLVPATRVRWRDVWLGSAITAILIMLGWQLILALVRGVKIDSILELASFIVLILTGIYYISLIVILGAVLGRAFAVTFGPQAGQSDS